MKRVKHKCTSCGIVTDDVYWNEPGTWSKMESPICAKCYEYGWHIYWHQYKCNNWCFGTSIKAMRTALFRKR